MIEALRSGHLRHAGLDVFTVEPLPVGHVLTTLPNVTLSAHSAFRTAASSQLDGILQYSEDPIVSTDINGNAYSCIFDSELTMVRGSTVKVFGWYDNEWGYSCRLVDLILKLLS